MCRLAAHRCHKYPESVLATNQTADRGRLEKATLEGDGTRCRLLAWGRGAQNFFLLNFGRCLVGSVRGMSGYIYIYTYIYI